MTAAIFTHKLRQPWPGVDTRYGDNAYVIARVCDADAQRGAAYVVPGQLWLRVAEGKSR